MTEAAIRTRLWRDGVLEKEDFPFEELSDYLCQPDCMVWADLQAPDAARLAELGEELSLDKLAIEDAVAHHERPKASRYSTHTFLTARALRSTAAAVSCLTSKCPPSCSSRPSSPCMPASGSTSTPSSTAGTRTPA